MMDLPVPVSDRIISYKVDGHAYLFKSERGILKIAFEKDKLVHICFTVSGRFEDKMPWIMKDVKDISSNISEDSDSYYIYSDRVIVSVSKENSSVRFSKNSEGNEFIFSEDGTFGRQFEEIREYITVDDGNISTKDIVTADGVKKVIAEANRQEGRLLYKSRLHLLFEDSEVLYGLGQAEEGILNLRGHVKYLHQANRKIAIPVIMSSKGYGLYFPSGSASLFCDNEEGTFFQTEASETMEYYMLGGDCIDESISLFRFLTGKAEMLPRWAYGYLQCKERYESEAELLEIADGFKKRNIGVDTLILDWITWEEGMWGQKTLDKKRFPDPKRMMDKLHKEDIHLMISIWPNMTKECDNYKEFNEKKLLYPGTGIYDAFSKEARELYWEQVNEGLYNYGIDGFWCDSSEPFTPEWTKTIKPDAATAYKDFIKAATDCMPYDRINTYGYYHAMGIYEGQRKTSKHRVMNLTRNGYPGSQKYGVVLWSGDIGASFDTLRRQVVEGLNICASGLPYWTLDIGAFFVKKGSPWFWEGKYPEGLNSLGYKELYVRWYQYGAFLPVFRSHGTDCPREPWQFGEKGDMFYDAIIKANELRYSLMPYIYSVAYKVWRDDYTMMRLLAFDFSEDEKALTIDDQFMFGPSLMVCPVLNAMYYDADSKELDRPKQREVYFPNGCRWYDIRSNDVYEGGNTYQVDCDIYSIPVFAKEGSIIPMCENLKNTANMEKESIITRVYGSKKSAFELYSDNGDGYEYQKGKGNITVL